MEFHGSVLFFRYQTDGIRSIWLFFEVPDQWNSIDLVIEISKCFAFLHFEYEVSWTAFLASGTPQQWISREKTEKKLSKNYFSLLKKWRFLENHLTTKWWKEKWQPGLPPGNIRALISAVRWHLRKILGISRIANLENLETFFFFFLTIWVSFCGERLSECDDVHYVISSTFFSVQSVKIFIFQVDILIITIIMHLSLHKSQMT